MPIAALYGPEDLASAGQQYFSTMVAQPHPASKAPALPRPTLDWTPEVRRATAHLYERVSAVISPVEWPTMAPTIAAINALKAARNAVILAH
ncbi:MAG TPA: quinolinate synthase NadA, partial [Bradyrhizobium sp.]|nr:quinolinate synthase NadA [Bradyrhizobium sp.]